MLSPLVLSAVGELSWREQLPTRERARRPRRVRAAASGSWCFFMSIDVSALYVSCGCTYVHDAYERTSNNQTATITNWNLAVAMCRADQVLSLKQNHLHSVPSSFMIFRGWMP